MKDRTLIAVQIVTNPQSAKPLTLTLDAPKSIHRGDMLNAVAVAHGGTGGYVYSKASGPAWLSISMDGYVSGTPDTIKRETFVVHVEDSSSTVAEHVFSIDVVSRLTPKWVTPVVGEIGIAYSYTLAVNGATGTVTWSVVSGSLPAGLSISGDVLQGTPSADGISYATLRASDAGTGDTLDVPISITIAKNPYFEIVPHPIEIGDYGRILPTAYAGTPYVIRGIPREGIGARRVALDVILQLSPFEISANQYNGSLESGVISVDLSNFANASPWAGGSGFTVIRLKVLDEANGYTETMYMLSVLGTDAPIDGNAYVRKNGQWQESGGGIASIVGDGTTTSVDNTDPNNPIVSALVGLDAAKAYTDAAIAALPPSGGASGSGNVYFA